MSVARKSPISSVHLWRQNTCICYFFLLLIGCGFKISTGAALLTFLFFCAGFWAWRAFGGLLAHEMRRDENVHLHWAKILSCWGYHLSDCSTFTMYSVSHMFIKITWDEVGGRGWRYRLGINRGRNAPYFTRHFDGYPALIPWFSTGSMVSLIPSFITYHIVTQWAVFSLATDGKSTNGEFGNYNSAAWLKLTIRNKWSKHRNISSKVIHFFVR
jgi:hypothetical protein